MPIVGIKREPDLEIEVTPRDFVMARLAAARRSAQSVIDALDEAVELFIESDEDDDGAERTELIETALESAGMCARALESAQEVMPAVDPEEIEPWDGDEDEDDDEPEEPEPEPKATARKRKRS